MFDFKKWKVYTHLRTEGVHIRAQIHACTYAGRVFFFFFWWTYCLRSSRGELDTYYARVRLEFCFPSYFPSN